MHACIIGIVKVVKDLMKLGLPRKYMNEQDSKGRTALMLALMFGNFDCALALIHDETDVSFDEHGNKHAALCKSLRKWGVSYRL